MHGAGAGMTGNTPCQIRKNIVLGHGAVAGRKAPPATAPLDQW